MSMEACVTLQEITELRKFGNAILTFTDVDAVVEETFKNIEAKLLPQTISFFLFSKEGCMERYKIHGRDKYNNIVENSWLSGEKYEPGESFSGKAAYGDPYGEPYWSNHLDKKLDKLSHGKDYANKLGFLKCGISVPLNGTRRTFGTIEVINRVDPTTGNADASLGFSESDVCWLTVVGAHVASAISRLRKKDEDKIFATISRVLADPELEGYPVHSMRQSVYALIAEKLVDQLMPYKACVLRLTFDGRSLIVTDKAHSDGEKGWIGRYDEPRFLGQGIVGKVFETGKPEKVECIQERENEFTNLEWIKSQKFKSFICFPLLVLGKVIGTLSLFIGYVHQFSDSDIDFLENVAFLLAAFKVRSEKVKNLEVPSFTADTLKDTNSQELTVFSRDAKYYFDNNLLDSFEAVSRLYHNYLEEENYTEAAEAANSAYKLCQKLIESIESERQRSEELYRKLVALSSYWKLNRDLYSVRGRIDGDG